MVQLADFRDLFEDLHRVLEREQLRKIFAKPDHEWLIIVQRQHLVDCLHEMVLPWCMTRRSQLPDANFHTAAAAGRPCSARC